MNVQAGDTALHYTSVHGQLGIAHLLVDKGAAVDQANNVRGCEGCVWEGAMHRAAV